MEGQQECTDCLASHRYGDGISSPAFDAKRWPSTQASTNQIPSHHASYCASRACSPKPRQGLRGQSQSIGCLDSQHAGAHEWRADLAAPFECIPTTLSCRIITTPLRAGPPLPSFNDLPFPPHSAGPRLSPNATSATRGEHNTATWAGRSSTVPTCFSVPVPVIHTQLKEGGETPN